MTGAAAGIPDTEPAFIDVGKDAGARKIAVRARAGTAPGLFWLSGFNSDMQGTKALALDAWAAEQGRACVRFDYSGHGISGGAFIDGTIGRGLEGGHDVVPLCLAGQAGCVRAVLGRPAGRDRLVDGRLDGAIAGARDRAAPRDRPREPGGARA